MQYSEQLSYAFVKCRAFLYIVVQSVGALVGAGILEGLYAEGITHPYLCTPAPAPAVTLGQTFGIEIIIAFVLVFTVFATCDSLRTGFNGSGPLAIGLSITMCHLWAVRMWIRNPSCTFLNVFGMLKHHRGLLPASHTKLCNWVGFVCVRVRTITQNLRITELDAAQSAGAMLQHLCNYLESA